jgi:hypothetical protein
MSPRHHSHQSFSRNLPHHHDERTLKTGSRLGPHEHHGFTPNLAANAFTASLAIFFASASLAPLLIARV